MKTPRKRGEATTQIQFFLQILFARLPNTYCFSHLGYISEWNRENHPPQKSYYLSDSKWQARVQTLQWLGSLRAWSLLHTPPPRFRKECWGETITDISFGKPHLPNLTSGYSFIPLSICLFLSFSWFLKEKWYVKLI